MVNIQKNKKPEGYWLHDGMLFRAGEDAILDELAELEDQEELLWEAIIETPSKITKVSLPGGYVLTGQEMEPGCYAYCAMGMGTDQLESVDGHVIIKAIPEWLVKLLIL